MVKSKTKHLSFERHAKLGVALALGFCLSAAGAFGQQYRNLEVTPDGHGGASGQYGGQNFQVEPDYSRPQNGAGKPVIVIPPQQNGTNGKTKKRCYTDGNGQSVCY